MRSQGGSPVTFFFPPLGVAIALGLGVAGYHLIAGFSWIDALLNASMILGGMGPVKPQAAAVALGDFNRDGHLDLVSAHASARSIWSALGTGTGTFAPAQPGQAIPETSGLFTDLALADLNLDGNLDLVAAKDFSSTVLVLLGKADGTFG